MLDTPCQDFIDISNNVHVRHDAIEYEKFYIKHCLEPIRAHNDICITKRYVFNHASYIAWALCFFRHTNRVSRVYCMI